MRRGRTEAAAAAASIVRDRLGSVSDPLALFDRTAAAR